MNVPINSSSCFELDQRNAKLICRACDNETKTGSGVTWCMTPGTGRPICGSDSETFHREYDGYEEVNITSDGDMVLRIVRNAHENTMFSCTRQCDNGLSQEHGIKVTVESMFFIST